MSTSSVELGGTMMCRSEAEPCSACVTVLAMSVAVVDGPPCRPGNRGLQLNDLDAGGARAAAFLPPARPVAERRAG